MFLGREPVTLFQVLLIKHYYEWEKYYTGVTMVTDKTLYLLNFIETIFVIVKYN